MLQLRPPSVKSDGRITQFSRWSVVVDVFSRLNFNGIFLFVPLKKLFCILSSVLRGIILNYLISNRGGLGTSPFIMG